jgi:hypothetical protein
MSAWSIWQLQITPDDKPVLIAVRSSEILSITMHTTWALLTIKAGDGTYEYQVVATPSEVREGLELIN